MGERVSDPLWGSIKAGRCKEAKSSTDDAGRNGSGKRNNCEAKLYLIEVSFDAIVDQAERKYLKDLPTSFCLEPEDVDHLRKAAWQIINESEEFQKFVEGLK